MTNNNPQQALTNPQQIVAIRIFHESDGWYVDGLYPHNWCTEACRRYETRAEALADVEDFRATYNIPADVPVREG